MDQLPWILMIILDQKLEKKQNIENFSVKKVSISAGRPGIFKSVSVAITTFAGDEIIKYTILSAFSKHSIKRIPYMAPDAPVMAIEIAFFDILLLCF